MARGPENRSHRGFKTLLLQLPAGFSNFGETLNNPQAAERQEVMTRQDTSDLNTVDGLTLDGDGTVDVERRDEHQALSIDDDTGALRSCSQAMSGNSGEQVLVFLRSTHDRAAVISIGIMQIVATAKQRELRQELENYLREEIADIERQVAADRESGDA